MHRISASSKHLPITVWAPAIETYICWTGGYVKPFLERLEQHLPAPRFRLVPMYSMSTEAIETVPDFGPSGIAFLPVVPDTLFEFLESGSPEDPAKLLGADRLRKDGIYKMVVSHPHGLRHYRTGDLFRVEGLVAGLPDLRFLRRSGLGYSFTGEKLTGEQVSEAIRKIRAQYSALAEGHALTCFPSRGRTLPCYRLVVVRMHGTELPDYPEFAKRFDELLCEGNLEYRSKRQTGRLGEVQQERLDVSEFRRCT